MANMDIRTERVLPLAAYACLLVGLLAAGPSQGGGLYLNEFSSTVQGNAGAGRGAWAPDASATVHNPALMTRLDDHQFATGLSLVVGQSRFDAEPSPSGPSTGNGGNQIGVAPAASFSYVHRVSDRVRFGLSLYSLSGTALNPSNDWSGRFQMTEISLFTISLSPVLAVRVTDWLSVGGGPLITYASFNWDLKAPLPTPPGGEAQVRIKNNDDWQAAGRVGAVFHPRNDFSLAFYYHSETDLDLDGRSSLEGVGAAVDDVNLPLPQFIEVSAYWQATDRIALLGTFNWEDWSKADNLDITVAGNRIAATTGARDTYKIGVGANYQLTNAWLLQTGITFDSSVFRNTDRTVAIPVDQQIRFSFGAQYDLSESLTLGGSFTYANLGQAEVRQSTVRGDYQDNDLFVLGVTLAFKKLPWSGKLTHSGESI